MTTGFGFKALDPTGATYYNNIETVYPIPRTGEKWGPWFEHPEPAEPDGCECGPGGWHVHKFLSLQYGPPGAYPWFVQWDGLIGEGTNKVRVARLRLRRISPKVLARSLRPPFNWGHEANLTRADLTGANLTEANLTWANLDGANLTGANLTRADLTGANLTEANLTWANLTGANLDGANLTRANLTRADLTGANLTGANLTRADLTGANLTGANLTGANLTGANLTGANLTRADLDGANLDGASLTRADLDGANLDGASLDGARVNKYTKWPVGYSVPDCVVMI